MSLNLNPANLRSTMTTTTTTPQSPGAQPENAPPYVLAAEYVLIGPAPDCEAVAAAFAALFATAPLPSQPQHCRGETVGIPTTTIKIWARLDGARLVEVTCHAPANGLDAEQGEPYYLPLDAAA